MADDRFRESLAGLSRALGERAASHPDPVGEAMERRAAVQAQFEAREQRLKRLVGGAAAALASTGLTVFILFLVWPPGAPSPAVPAFAAPQAVTAAPQPIPVPAPPPALVAASEPAPVPVEEAPPPSPPALGRGEVREIQTRLFAFGFDPGPADGDAGRRTRAAISTYQQNRGHPQTGKADRALLEQLRQDPAPKVDPPPQVAQRAPRQELPRPAGPQARRASDPLEFLRNADGSISRWLNSLSR